MKKVEIVVKPLDVSKYNLRCNRSLSEKMTKKDFVYDIRRPLQTVGKCEKPRKQPTVISEEPRRSKLPKMKNHSKILRNDRLGGGGGDATMQFPVHRVLNFECNFCQEQLATLRSLSTHVKFHRRNYCKKCYWILKNDETMQNHFDAKHGGSSSSQICINL